MLSAPAPVCTSRTLWLWLLQLVDSSKVDDCMFIRSAPATSARAARTQRAGGVRDLLLDADAVVCLGALGMFSALLRSAARTAPVPAIWDDRGQQRGRPGDYDGFSATFARRRAARWW
jgi:hypothetical protein